MRPSIPFHDRPDHLALSSGRHVVTRKQPMNPDPTSSSTSTRALEIAHVLFMDIVAYSQLRMDEQTRVIELLQQIVRNTAEFSRAQKRRQLLRLPTGDGMALVFFGEVEAPVRCALEISRALREQPELQLRMGIHTGPVQRVEDINANRNVAGGGINVAQRVMDCGDSGHILVSGAMADLLSHVSDWPKMLHDLGEAEVKHGIRIRIYNLYAEELGNPSLPRKITDARSRSIVVPTSSAPSPTRWVRVVAPAVLVLLAGTYLAMRHRPGVRSDAGKTPVSASPANLERILRYAIIVQKQGDSLSQGKPFAVSGQPIFAASDRVRLTFSSPQPGYLYIVDEDPASTRQQPVFNSLFPSPSTNQGSALLSPDSELTIPEHGAFVFDKKGVERLWLVWSKESIPEMEALKKWVNQKDRGSVGDAGELLWLQSFLARSPTLQTELRNDENDPIRELGGKGDVLAYLIKLEHE